MSKFIRVQKVNVFRVPVELPDNFNIFELSGSMTAVAFTALPTTEWFWEQISGTPVTYTTPLNTPSISWTTTDLEFKRFRVWTNKGTVNEEFAEGVFLHYPNESLINSFGVVESSIKVNSLITADDFNPSIRRGVTPINLPSAYNTPNLPDIPSSVNIGGVGDIGSSVQTVTKLPTDLANQIVTTTLMKDVGGVWTVEHTDTGFVSLYEGVTPNTGYRVVYSCSLKGYSYEVIVDMTYSNNACDSLELSFGSVNSSISNITYNISKNTKLLYQENIDNNFGVVVSDISNISTNISSLTNLTYDELTDYNMGTVESSIDNFSYSLQTSTGVI